MTTMKKSAEVAMERSRETAARVGKVAKSTAIVAAKAGVAAAVTAGTVEAARVWKETSPAAIKHRRNVKIAAAVAGAAMVGAAGVAIARSRSKANGKKNGKSK